MQNPNHSSLENSLSNYNPSDESNQYNLYEQQTYGSSSIYDGQTFSNQSDESCELSVEHQQSFPEQSHNFFQFNTNHSQGAAQNGSLGIVSDFKQQVHYPPPPQSTSFFMPYHNNQKQSHTSECLNEELEVHPIKPDLQEQAMEHEIQSANDKSDGNDGKEICLSQMIQNEAHSSLMNIQENDLNTEANRFMNLEANRNMEANSSYSRNIVGQHDPERTIIGSFGNSSSTNNDQERKKENLKNQEKQTVRAGQKAHLHEYDQIRKMRKPQTKKNESSEEL